MDAVYHLYTIYVHGPLNLHMASAQLTLELIKYMLLLVHFYTSIAN